MKSNCRVYQRMLTAEQLERRELLAADWCGRETLIAPDASGPEDVMIVQGQEQVVADAAATPPQQRERNDEDSDTGVGRQKRPRDRDSEDALPSVVTALSLDEAGTLEAVALQRIARGGQQRPGIGQLSQGEIDDIRFIREEEKLARDVYITLGIKWNTPIFANIAESESRHMAAVKNLIDKYGLVDPVVDDTVGSFNDPLLQRLYDDLVGAQDIVDLSYLGISLTIEGGATSELAAYKVGAFIEEFDILDIERAIQNVTHSDIENVYENLLKGSRNHLRSFVSQIEAIDAVYDPVLMTGVNPGTGEDLDASYQQIISTEQETGGQGSRRGNRVHASTANQETIELLACDQLFGNLARGRRGR